MFADLTSKFKAIFKRIKSKGKLNEKDIKNCLYEIRIALLEADVNYKVVKEFVNELHVQMINENISESLSPSQQIIKMVHREITKVLGSKKSDIVISPKPPTVILIVGLQGTGKTTTAVKLANYLNKKGNRSILVATDIHRPAAIEQLKILAEKSKLPVFSMGTKEKAVNIVKAALNYVSNKDFNILIVDTAGRLHIDEKLMSELEEIDRQILPQEKLLIIDSMAGQDAVNSARVFCEKINVNGIILSKIDGDARGGAALSLRKILDAPIKFVGTGEKIENIDIFYPERMASRILGMGDVLTLIEKVESAYDKKEISRMNEKIKSNNFDLNDFYLQLKKMENIGSVKEIVGMIPGASRLNLNKMQYDDRELKKIEAIISSMTMDERNNPNIINGNRRKRIARGSGSQISEVNRLLKQFNQIKNMMKKRKFAKNFPFN